MILPRTDKKYPKRLSSFRSPCYLSRNGRNRDFYATPRFAYLRVVKRLKMVQLMNWLMGLEKDFISKLDSEPVLVIVVHPQWLNLSNRRIAK